MGTGKLGATLALAMGLAGLTAGQAEAAAFVNGGFEADNWNTGGGPVLNLDGGGGVTGWTTVDPAPASLYFIEGWNNANGAGPTPFGNQWIALGEEGLGGNYVEQTVAGFTLGNNYSLTFSVSSETALAQAILSVSLPGSAVPSAVFNAPMAAARSWDTWQTYSYDFTADAAALTFRFTDLSNAGNTALGLDNISVAEVTGGRVPEPDGLVLVLTAGALIVGVRKAAGSADVGTLPQQLQASNGSPT